MPDPPGGDAEEGPPPDPEVRLGKLPDVKLLPRPPVGDAQAKRIKRLIADLANLDSPDFGLSPTLSGYAFAPIAGQERAQGGLITDHQLKQSEALKELVALGPTALPFLLDALNDKTPTKLVIEHNGFFGHMGHNGYLQSINPVNPAEAAVYKARRGKPARSYSDGEGLTSYNVTVGDVCFVAIGQIVGREYQAVSYFPTANIILTSPSEDAKLCADLRAMWGGKDPVKHLFDSLLADFATEGIPRKDDFPYGWRTATLMQSAAALRLLYYFPRESTALVKARLEKMCVNGTLGVEESKRDEVTPHYWINGIDTEEFIKAVSWCKEPAIRSALISIFKRTTDRDILLAAIDAVEDRGLIHRRLEALIDKLPPDGGRASLDELAGEYLLRALARRCPDTAKPVFERFLRGGNPDRCAIVCFALLWGAEVTWDVDVLAPLLDDTREVTPSTRVCDWAAEALTRHYPELEFELGGTQADMDKQIAVIKERLKRKK